MRMNRQEICEIAQYEAVVVGNHLRFLGCVQFVDVRF
jgi:hypothetical protein